MTGSVVNAGLLGANALSVIASVTSGNPFLEYIQNGASVAAVMGIFLWREMKRAERYERLYDDERKKRIDAENKCSGCEFVRKTIRVHQAIAQDVQAALAEVLAAYGLDRIRALHLDQYGGSYNDRSTAGGKSKSMHAWGIALDFDPERNSYSSKAPHAGLSRPECEEWWRIWEAHGAVSLGRERNYDWMHLQFARL